MYITDVLAHLVDHVPGVDQTNREEMRQAVADHAAFLRTVDPAAPPEPPPAVPEPDEKDARIAELEAALAAPPAPAPGTDQQG